MTGDDLREVGAQITVGDLRQLSGSAHRLSETPPGLDANMGVLSGRYSFNHLVSGLSLHGGRVVEIADMQNYFELPPGISMNFVLDGRLEFVCGGKLYRIECNKSPVAEKQCATIVAAQSELITRRISQGNTLTKLNLFISREWLMQRCGSEKDRRQVHTLFATQPNVLQWDISDALASRVESTMLAAIDDTGSFNSLRLEAEAIALAHDAMIDLLKAAQVSTNAAPGFVARQAPLPRESASELKAAVEKLVESNVSLKALSSQLNMSVSTLQRKFKYHFGVTVIEYTRQRRLEIAKDLMVRKNITVGQAADIAGYKHASNFVSAFKRHFNTTPEEYKRAHR